MTTALRRLAAPVAALALALTGVVGLTATPADAATPSFYGTNAPLEWNSTVYNGPSFSETGTGVTYIGDDGAHTWVDTEPGEPISGFTGTTNVHAALATYDFGSGTQNVTIFVSDQVLQDGSYPATCAGIDAALFGGATVCDAIVPNMLTSNGAATDYSANGTGGAIDASDNPTTVYDTGDITPNIVWPNYQGSASPFTYNGTDFDGALLGGPGNGSGWLPAGTEPFFVTGQPIALPIFPYPDADPNGPYEPVHLALVNNNGLPATVAVAGEFFYQLDPMNPFPANCTGMNDFFTAVSFTGVECIAFRADVWSPPDTLGETYTCAANWYKGWTDGNDAPIDPANSPTVIDGYDLPALTPIGTDAGPGVCVAATPPEPPPTPPTTTPGSAGNGSGTGGSGTGGTDSTAGTSGAPTLPATGATTPALLLGALALMTAGAGVTLMARRRTRTACAATGD